MKPLRLALWVCLLFAAWGISAAKPKVNYAALARELESTSRDKKVVKIAVLPFEEIGTKDPVLGREVQEELTFALVKYTRFNVLERSLVNRALGELAFQQTGAMDAASVKKIGAGVGAEAVVSGTVQKGAGGELRVMARLIRTETFDILAVASSHDSPRSTAEQHSVAPQSSPAAPIELYIEAFAGYALPGTMSLNFGNDTTGVDSLYAGVPGTNTKYKLIEYRDLSAAAGTPFGLRLRSATRYVQVGGEYLYRSYAAKAQTAQVAFNGGAAQAISLAQDPFFSVNAHDLNLVLTFSYRLAFIEPYAGGVAGLGFYKLSSPAVYSYSYTSGVATFQPGLSSLELGFSASGLAGLRLHFSDSIGMFFEGRYTTSLVNHTREIKNETDQVQFAGWSVFGGLAVKL